MSNWKSDTYSISKLDSDIKNELITIPQYQRGIVWNETKKNNLINTLKEGLPFGSILIYRDDKKNTKSLIDGLQRCSTIFEFNNNPSKYFNEKDIDDDVINEIFQMTNYFNSINAIKEKIIKTLTLWIKTDHPTMETVQNMQFTDFAFKLSEIFPTLQSKEKTIGQLIKPMMQKFIDMCKSVATITIPVIEFFGDESLLPELFERINSSGANLTKYQIYAASWSNDLIKITDNKLSNIIDKICIRYDELVKGDIKIESYDSVELKKTQKINVFDLCYGFGKYIREKYKHLFGYDEDKIKIESIGFNLINACLGSKNSDTKFLPKLMKERLLTNENINLFLVKILECIDIVDRKLSFINKFKGNTRSSTVSSLHTEFQIVSIISSIFSMKFINVNQNDKGHLANIKIDLQSNQLIWKKYKDSFNDNLIKIYVMDIIHEKWKGSGDKKLDNILFNYDIYARNVSWDEFSNSLLNWYQSNKYERNEVKKVAEPKESEKVLLNIIYSKEFSAFDQIDDSKYDIEHICPKNKMKKSLEKYADLKLPISSIANLCYLPEYENRSKKDKTFYEDKNYIIKVNIKEIESKYSFTTEGDLIWLNDENLSAEEFKNEYIKLLDKRYEVFEKKLKEILFKKDQNAFMIMSR